MSEPKGPKVDIPEDLVSEIAEDPTPSEPGAAPEDVSEEADASSAGGTQEPPAEADVSDAPSEDLDALNDKYLRLAAEFDNFRRRTLKERQDLLNYGNENLMRELLGTIDNLERALAHARDSEDLDRATILEGLELTHRSLLQVLGKFGVQVVEAEGKTFDPQLHEAVRQAESADHAPGTVMQVFQTGYLLLDRLLRPALVTVAGPGSGSEGGE